MKAKDFELNGRNLSDFGMMICVFGSKGLETISNGANVTFNTVAVQGGKKNEITSTLYEDCLEATIQVCKYSCSKGIEEITSSEFRELTKWLGRNKFLKFKLLDEDHMDLYYEAKFDISRIEIDGKLYGLELQVTTNTPFALKEPRNIIILFSIINNNIYPHMEVVVKENGILNIYNAIEDRNTIIKNCVQGETITMNYPIIQSSLLSHKIQNDFNWNFFRIANSYNNGRNDLTISLPCEIKMVYSPIVKVGL